MISYIQFTISFTIGRKRTPNFQFFASGTSSSCRLYNNHVKDTRGDGHFMNGPNHVKLASFVLVADLHIFTGLEINYQFHLLS